MTNHLAEYQGSQNKYHRHDKGDYKIVGEVKMHRGSVYETNSNGAMRGRDYILGESSTIISLSGSGSMGLVELNTDFNSGAGFTGNSGYNGLNGQASKPATIACMWILRFI